MRGIVAKRLRREAQALTVGWAPAKTRAIYRQLKREYKQRVHDR